MILRRPDDRSTFLRAYKEVLFPRMRLDRADEMTLIPDVKRVVARVSRKAGSPYKLTPHFTEGSSLISSRFLLRAVPLDTSLNSTPIPPLRGLLRGGKQATPALLFAHFSGCLTAINHDC